MSYTRLVESYNKLSDYNHAIFEWVNYTFPPSQFNVLNLYNLPKVKYSHLTYTGQTPEQVLQVVHSAAGGSKSLRRVSRAYQAHRLFARKQIPDTFNLTYLYSSPSGTVITPYYPDGDLFEYITGKGELVADIASLRHVLAQILLAMWDYHCKLVVHRDIKPENILISLINNKPFIKLADHDDAVEVNASGNLIVSACSLSEYKDFFLFGTLKYYSPELTKTLETFRQSNDMAECRAIVENYNLLAEDCFQIGKLLECLLFGYINRNDFNLIKKYSAEKKYDETPHSQIALLYGKLLIPSAQHRWTVQDAINCEFFGKTEKDRGSYFNLIANEAETTLLIDNIPFESKRIEFHDALYLQGADIKAIHSTAYKILQIMHQCHVSFTHNHDNFDEAINIANSVKSTKDDMRAFRVKAQEIRRSSQKQEFFDSLNNFESELRNNEAELESQFCSDVLPSFIYLTVEAAINEYSEKIRMNLIKSSDEPPQNVYPLTLFQKLACNDKELLKKSLKSANNYQRSFREIKKYIGDEENHSDSSFKSHLIAKLKLVLHKPLEEIQEDCENSKRRRLR